MRYTLLAFTPLSSLPPLLRRRYLPPSLLPLLLRRYLPPSLLPFPFSPFSFLLPGVPGNVLVGNLNRRLLVLFTTSSEFLPSIFSMAYRFSMWNS